MLSVSSFAIRSSGSVLGMAVRGDERARARERERERGGHFCVVWLGLRWGLRGRLRVLGWDGMGWDEGEKGFLERHHLSTLMQ